MIIQKKLDNIKLETVITTVLLHLKELNFKSLLVGGCVRDAILNIQPKDIDVEVYSISYEKLKEVLCIYGNVNLVGKAFGVIKFNPSNSDMTYDFSIPRKENKIGVKHQDFEVVFDETMSIEIASSRRDFTFNSLAYDPIDFEIHDYYGGLSDIENKIMRHTSDAFSEDVLRILRGLQFQARFGFELHPDTAVLMQEMLKSGEFELLPKERVFEEFLKWAEKGTGHDLIFKFMRESGLIEHYPELKALKETPQDAIWHPEGDVEVHTCLCLKQIDRIIEENNITGIEKIILVLSVLTHDIGKPNTTAHEMKNGRMAITSKGHEALGGKMVIEFLSSLGFNEAIITPISNIVANHLAGVSISMITSPSGKTRAVKKLSRRLHPATIQQLLFLMSADSNGRGSSEHKEATGSRDIIEIAKDLNVTVKQYEYIVMGRHLIEWYNLKPSKEFGIILSRVNEAQENGLFSDLESGKMWLDDNLQLLIDNKSC